MNLLIGAYQAGQLAETRSSAEQATERTRRMEADVDDLRRRTDALTIACQALWEIVQSRLGVDDQIVLGKMQEIDLRDGQADGKISWQTVVCARCSRNSSSKRRTCLYCGAPLPVGNLFEKS